MVALIIGLQYCCTHFVVLAPQNNVSYINDWHWAIWNKSHFVNVTIGRFEKNLHFFIYSVKLQKTPASFKKSLLTIFQHSLLKVMILFFLTRVCVRISGTNLVLGVSEVVKFTMNFCHLCGHSPGTQRLS